MAHVVAYPHLKTRSGDAQIEMNRLFPSPREFIGKSLLKKKKQFGRRRAAISTASALPLLRDAKEPGLCKAFTRPTPSSRGREYTRREEPDYYESTRHFISAFHQHPSLKSPVCSACRAGSVDTASVPLAGRGDCSYH